MPVLAAGAAGALILVVVMLGAVTGGIVPTLQPQSAPCSLGEAAPTGKVGDIPPTYLALYVQAGLKYGIPWQVLAGIGDIESDHGRSKLTGVASGENSAGAGGPMQFLPGTWKAFGVDGNSDGRRDRYNPADAIPAAARYLKHNGAPKRLRTALYRYNHSRAYVEDVLKRARTYASGQNPETLAQVLTADCDPELNSIAVPSATVAKIITFALAQRGKRYVFGAEGPDAWDCSSLVQAAYRAAGLTIPRSTFAQWPFGVRIRKGTEQPGDLVFFNSGPNTASGRPGHVGLVIAPGKMVAARCSTCQPNIGIQNYRVRSDWVGSTRPLLRFKIKN